LTDHALSRKRRRRSGGKEIRRIFFSFKKCPPELVIS
jgi:hypothetical protein